MEIRVDLPGWAKWICHDDIGGIWFFEFPPYWDGGMWSAPDGDVDYVSADVFFAVPSKKSLKRVIRAVGEKYTYRSQ